MLRQKSLLIQTMPDFVQYAVKRFGKIQFIVAGRQTHIMRPQIRAKWMSGGVNPARFKIKSHGPRYHLVELFLTFQGIKPLKIVR